MTNTASPAEWTEDLAEYTRLYLNAYQQNVPKSVPGYSVAVYQNGQRILAEGYGFADKESETQMTEEHMFHVASQSKTITTIAIMQLVEQGKLSLDDKASQHIPEMLDNPDEHVHNITIRELLCHKSFLSRDMEKNFWTLQEPFPDEAELIETLKTQPHIELPKEKDAEKRMKYSNYGYGALGLVLERASGQNFEAYVTEHIFKPLGLTDKDITVEYKPQNKNRQATAYSRMGLGGKQVGFRESAITTNALASATGVCATPSAMARIFSIFLPGNDELLTPQSKAEMITPDGMQPLNYPDYGLGIRKHNSCHGHSGGSPLEVSYTFANPKNGTVVSVSFNNISGPNYELGDSLHNICSFFSEHPKKSEKLAAYNLQEFVHPYNIFHTLARKNDKGEDVIYLPTGGTKNPFTDPIELHQNSDNPEHFTAKVKAENSYPGEKAIFTRDDDDRITLLTLGGLHYLPPDILESVMKKVNTSRPPERQTVLQR